MRWFGLFLIVVLCNNCQNKYQSNVSIEIDGLFTSSEVGLINIDSALDSHRYFSINVMNNTKTPIVIATTGKERFYSPLYTEYTYFSKKNKERKRGGGTNDFFSSKETMIHPSQSSKFCFVASIPSNTDTVDYVFKYLKRDSTCYVETSYFLKDMKVMNLLNYNTFCE